jgi:hypothetical protein
MSFNDFKAKASRITDTTYLPQFISNRRPSERSDRGRGFHLWLHRFLTLDIPIERYMKTLWNVEGLTEHILVGSQLLWNVQGTVEANVNGVSQALLHAPTTKSFTTRQKSIIRQINANISKAYKQATLTYEARLQ